MLRSLLLFLSVAVFLPSCSLQEKDARAEAPPSQRQTGDHFLVNDLGDTIPTGVPIPIQGKAIHPDRVAKPQTIPLQSPPRITSLLDSVRLVGEPVDVKVPEKLTIVTPGKDGVPLPASIPARGVIVPVAQPQPVPVGNLDLETKGSVSFYSLNVEQGLNHSNVRAIFEDKRGDKWFGTDNGVSRYDGATLTHYTTEVGLSGNNVWAIVEDQVGRLWFGTNDGLSRYDGVHFTNFKTRENFWVRTMMEDSRGNLWIGSFESGLLRFDGKEFTDFTNFISGNNSQNVSALYEDREGNIWIGTWENGVFRYDGYRFVHYTMNEGLSSNSIWSIMEDSRGAIWIGTNGGGASRLMPIGDEQHADSYFTPFATGEGLYHTVMCIEEDLQGQLWFGTWGGGLSRLFLGNNDEDAGFITYTTEDGLSSSTVLCLMADTLGRLWFGAGGGGVNQLVLGGTKGSRWTAFTHYSRMDGLSSNEIRSFLEDTQGNIWIGTLGGVHRFDGANLTHYSSTQGLIRNDIRAIMEDHQGNLWFGTRVGVNRFDGVSFTNYTEKEGLNGGEYWFILQDRQKNIWFGSNQNGVSRLEPDEDGGYDGATFTHFTAAEDLLGNRLNHMMEDSRGRLWFATDRGASRYDPAGGTLTHLTTNEGLPTTAVRYIAEDSRGSFWFATDLGISRYNGRIFTHYTTKDGLSANQTRSIVIDHQQRVWVATVKGITLFVPDSDKSVSDDDPQADDYRLFTFSHADGLKESGFTEDVLLDSRNRIWWGTNAGVTMLDLNHFQLPTASPKIRLNTISVDQQFVDYRQLRDTFYQGSLPNGAALSETFDSVTLWYNYPVKLTLPHHLNHLTFHFSGIDWAAPHKLAYSYLLEGLDERWSPPKREDKADYRNLPPGNYTFKVKAIGAAQIWSNVFQYAFTIRPPWWRTWVAYALYFSLILLTLYSLRRYELRRYLALSEARRLQELDAFKTRLYTNITHEFRTPLTIILGMARQIKDDPKKWYDEGLQMITRNGKQLLNLVNQMLDLSKLDQGNLKLHPQPGEIVAFLHYLVQSFESYAAGKNIQLHFLKEIDQLEMDYDPDQLTKVANNLLSNAVKFTPEGGQIYVMIRSRHFKPGTANDAKTSEALEMRVKDTGIGIAPEDLPHIFDRFYQAPGLARKREGSGVGLSLARELIQLMGGEIQVYSKIREGSDFVVLLPVSRSAPKGEPGLAPIEIPRRETIVPIGLINASAVESDLGTEWGPPGKTAAKDLPVALLIEDNRDVLTYLASCLEGDYQLEFAMNGREGIDQALEIVPDIIISDVMMPEKDGYELCAILKEDILTSHIPIILLTAKADRDARLEGIKAGADAYLAKPFDKEELNILMEKMLALRRQLQARYGALQVAAGKKEKVMSREDLFLQELRETVEANLSEENFGIAQLCRRAGMSRSQLHNKIKALTGLSTSHFIRAIRLEKAKELLRTTDMNISEVAYEVGFRTPLYFTQVFTEEVGVAPSAFRIQD